MNLFVDPVLKDVFPANKKSKKKIPDHWLARFFFVDTFDTGASLASGQSTSGFWVVALFVNH